MQALSGKDVLRFTDFLPSLYERSSRSEIPVSEMRHKDLFYAMVLETTYRKGASRRSESVVRERKASQSNGSSYHLTKGPSIQVPKVYHQSILCQELSEETYREGTSWRRRSVTGNCQCRSQEWFSRQGVICLRGVAPNTSHFWPIPLIKFMYII